MPSTRLSRPEGALLHKTVKEAFSILDLFTKYDIPELPGDTRNVQRNQVPVGRKLFGHVVTEETSNLNLQAVFEVYNTVTNAYNTGKGLASPSPSLRRPTQPRRLP